MSNPPSSSCSNVCASVIAQGKALGLTLLPMKWESWGSQQWNPTVISLSVWQLRRLLHALVAVNCDQVCLHGQVTHQSRGEHDQSHQSQLNTFTSVRLFCDYKPTSTCIPPSWHEANCTYTIHWIHFIISTIAGHLIFPLQYEEDLITYVGHDVLDLCVKGEPMWKGFLMSYGSVDLLYWRHRATGLNS